MYMLRRYASCITSQKHTQIYALALRVCALLNCGLYVFVCVCVCVALSRLSLLGSCQTWRRERMTRKYPSNIHRHPTQRRQPPADAVVRSCSLYIHIYLNTFVDVYVCEFEISHLPILSPDSRPHIFSLLCPTV